MTAPDTEDDGATGADPLRGIALKVASVLVFTLMATFIKAARDEVPPGEAVFFRSFFALVPLLAYMAWRHDIPAAMKTGNLVSHVTRGLVGVAAMGAGFLALGLLPLPEAIAIGYASPIFATLLAAAILGEVVRAFRLTAVAIGMVGVLIILWPKLTLFSSGGASTVEGVGALAALVGAFFGATAMVIVRRMVLTERPSTIVFYFSITASVVGLATLPFGWVLPSALAVAFLVGAGLLGGIGQILLTESYRLAETSTIAPFEYSSMIFGVAIGFFAFQEAPDIWTIAGSAVVIAAGIIIILREHRLGIERARSRRSVSPQG